MFRSALANGQSLMGKLVFVGGAASLALTLTVPTASANAAAANASDNFRIAPEDVAANKTPLGVDRKSTRLNSSHLDLSRMPSSA